MIAVHVILVLVVDDQLIPLSWNVLFIGQTIKVLFYLYLRVIKVFDDLKGLA